MLIVTLRWTEPEDGTHRIVFPDGDEAEVKELAAYLKEKWGDDYGETVASVKAKRGLRLRKGEAVDAADEDPWKDLALNVRYTSGEGLYDKDIPIFAKRGIARQ